MDNKKLLKFLLTDLSELEDLISEKEDGIFDELEMELLKTRISGAKRVIKLLAEKDNSVEETGEHVKANSEKKEPEIKEEDNEPTKQHKKEKDLFTNKEDNTRPDTGFVEEEKESFSGTEEIADNEIQPAKQNNNSTEKEIETIEKEELKDNKTAKTLGDSFTKEKSVNDLIDSENSNLEQKLSNRPIDNIKASIGINDRFQYIRELFEGNADRFVKAVEELDSKQDITEAVDYLKKNFKWQKNETSLKFINLVKRRFSK